MNDAGVRLFFALLPEPEVRQALLAWQRATLPPDARATHPDDLHLTLHFLGQVPETRVPILTAVGESMHLPGFDLQLDRLGVFRKARVLWLGSQTECEALTGMHRALAERLQQLDQVLDERSFRPHVTLARKVATRPPVPALPPVHWEARRWALLASKPGRVPLYRPLKIWRLDENFH